MCAGRRHDGRSRERSRTTQGDGLRVQLAALDRVAHCAQEHVEHLTRPGGQPVRLGREPLDVLRLLAAAAAGPIRSRAEHSAATGTETRVAQGNMRLRRYSHLQLHVAVPAYSQVTHSVRVMQLQLPALADFCKYRPGRYSQFARSHTCSLLATQKVPSAILSYIT